MWCVSYTQRDHAALGRARLSGANLQAARIRWVRENQDGRMALPLCMDESAIGQTVRPKVSCSCVTLAISIVALTHLG